MNVKEFLDKINVSQEEFAVFTGIPRGRIAAWILHNKETPPKVADAQIYQIAVKFLSNIPTEQVKEAIKQYRVLLNNVVSKEEFNSIAKHSSVVEEQPETYKKTPPLLNISEIAEQFQNGVKEAMGANFNKNDETIVYRMLHIWEQSNDNVRIMADAIDKFGDANKDLAATIKSLVSHREQ